jgi:hypothetical protein
MERRSSVDCRKDRAYTILVRPEGSQRVDTLFDPHQGQKISIRSLALTRHGKTAIATPEKRLGLRRKICEIWDRSQLLKRGHP